MAAVMASIVRAQEPSATREQCTARGRTIAAFAARRHAWAVRDPSATRRLVLGRGTVWNVDENRACCPSVVRRHGSTRLELSGCSVRSESRTAHVGEAGARTFALTRSTPAAEMAVAGENLLAAPWPAVAWSAFARAARAVPVTEEQALTLATHVHATLWHGLGIIRDQPSVEVGASSRDREALLRELSRARQLGLGPIESRAVRTGGGFVVTLWSSRRVAATSELDPGGGPGAVATEELRRTKLTIARDGTILVVEVVAATGDLQRSTAR